MARIHGKDTKPELALRKALHALGVRFRIHDKSLPGRPDISHKGAAVVFVDGCYWHGCRTHFRMPASNVAYWRAKRTYVDDLRHRKKEALEELGFLVIEVWEHEVRADANAVAFQVASAIASRSPVPRLGGQVREEGE